MQVQLVKLLEGLAAVQHGSGSVNWNYSSSRSVGAEIGAEIGSTIGGAAGLIAGSIISDKFINKG